MDPNAEREVDLRSAWNRITARWWLPVGGLVLGAILGVLVSIGSGDVYKAESLIYLGQPFTPAGGGQLQSLQTNPKTVSEIIRSEAAMKTAAEAAGMSPAGLRGNVTSTAVVQAGQVARNFTPLVQIEVRAPTRVKAEQASNSFANTVTTEVVPYVEQKMRLLRQQVANDEAQLDDIDTRIDAANNQQRAANADTTLSLAEKLLVSTNSNATMNGAEQRRGTVRRPEQRTAAPVARRERRALAGRTARRRRPRVRDEQAQRRRDRRARGAAPRRDRRAVADPWLRRRSTAAA